MPDSRTFTMACVNILGVCDDIAPSGNNATPNATVTLRIESIELIIIFGFFEGEPLSRST